MDRTTAEQRYIRAITAQGTKGAWIGRRGRGRFFNQRGALPTRLITVPQRRGKEMARQSLKEKVAETVEKYKREHPGYTEISESAIRLVESAYWLGVLATMENIVEAGTHGIDTLMVEILTLSEEMDAVRREGAPQPENKGRKFQFH
jgi:hypothetical protein